MTTPDLFAPLMPLVDHDATETTKSLSPLEPTDHMICGRLGATRFVVTLAEDGRCYASLSAAKGLPTVGQINAFWRRWGIEPISATPTTIISGRIIFFKVRDGAIQ